MCCIPLRAKRFMLVYMLACDVDGAYAVKMMIFLASLPCLDPCHFTSSQDPKQVYHRRFHSVVMVMILTSGMLNIWINKAEGAFWIEAFSIGRKQGLRSYHQLLFCTFAHQNMSRY